MVDSFNIVWSGSFSEQPCYRVVTRNGLGSYGRDSVTPSFFPNFPPCTKPFHFPPVFTNLSIGETPCTQWHCTLLVIQGVTALTVSYDGFSKAPQHRGGGRLWKEAHLKVIIILKSKLRRFRIADLWQNNDRNEC